MEKTISVGLTLFLAPTAAPAVEGEAAVAIGSAERACRERGDCLQTGNFDGALGLNWGGRDRCDARDPSCRTDGRLEGGTEGSKEDFTPPKGTREVTDVLSITFSIGSRGNETVQLNIGLFGDEYPEAVEQMLLTFSDRGLVTGPKLALEEGFGVSSLGLMGSYAMVTYVGAESGTVTVGIPSQKVVYAKEKNMGKAPDDFQPQPRPRAIRGGGGVGRDEGGVGTVAIDKRGLGWLEEGRDLDSAFDRLFELRGYGRGGVGRNDEEEKILIGQLMDKSSMEGLYRLSTLPVNKKFQGIIGAKEGPPLVNVRILGVKQRHVVVGSKGE